MSTHNHISSPATEALARAVEIAGGQAELARRLSTITGRSVKQGHVWSWLNVRPIPPEFVIPVERVTDAKVKRHELRPDIYPPEDPNRSREHRRRN